MTFRVNQSGNEEMIDVNNHMVITERTGVVCDVMIHSMIWSAPRIIAGQHGVDNVRGWVCVVQTGMTRGL